MKPAGLALAVALAVLLLAGSAAIRNFSHPGAVSPGTYSDHFSHLGSTVLFAARGFDIYRRPVRENLTRSPMPKDLAYAQSNELGAEELFVNPLDPARPPLAINWSFEIRAYPPGLYLLYVPVAFLFQREAVGFAAANRIVIIVLVLVASLSAWVLVRWALSSPPGMGVGRVGRAGLGLRLLPVTLSIFWIALWAVRGFYDIVALLFVFLSLRELEAENGVGAVSWYCLALFLHYRALYYLPVLGFALPTIAGSIKTRGLAVTLLHSPILLALLAAAFSAATLSIALPQLETFSRNNPLYHLSDLAGPQLLPLALAAVCLGLSAAARDFRTLGFLVCYLLFLVRTPQTYPWHTLFLTPMLMVAVRDTHPAAKTRFLALLTLFIALAVLVYHV